MRLATYNPWQLLDELHSGFDGFGQGRGTDRKASGETAVHWRPTVDIKEKVDGFVLYVDVPGIDPKDIEITVDKGVLTIRGERVAETEEDGEQYARLERARGVFYRRFALPSSADAEKVEAHGKHGVLEVVIPKRDEHQPRRIPIAA